MVTRIQKLEEKPLRLPSDREQIRPKAVTDYQMAEFNRQMGAEAGDQETPSDTRYGHLAIHMLIANR